MLRLDGRHYSATLYSPNNDMAALFAYKPEFRADGTHLIALY